MFVCKSIANILLIKQNSIQLVEIYRFEVKFAIVFKLGIAIFCLYLLVSIL
jgi:hypothetical protein